VCAENDPDFENVLWHQVNDRITLSNETLGRFGTPQIVAGVVPASFQLESIHLPFWELDNGETASRKQKVNTEVPVAMFVLMCLFLFIALIALGILCLDVYFKYQAKECLCKYSVFLAFCILRDSIFDSF